MIPPRPRRNPTPASIGPYKILEELGRGAQGVVYLAHDAAGERVAIKSVAPDFPPNSPDFERLRREGEFLAVLDHPNIARVHAIVEHAARLYLVMEYIEGQSLAERLRFGPLPENDGLSICRQIALAIDAAHRARVVHRDLKPANIRISPDGDVKVLDFGVAAYASASGVPTAASGTMVGTYGYMAPEQMMGGEVDHRADIWAFGCILFECLAGHPLFAGISFDDVFLRVACRDADLGRLPSGTHRRLRGVLRQCLVRHPAGRLNSIGEALGVIDSILSRRAHAARPGALTNLPRRPNSFVGREREIAAIVAHLRFSTGVCITGPGGSGKTRLASETATRLLREYREGVWFVDFSERAPADPIAPAIREALPRELVVSRQGDDADDADDNSRLAAQLAGARALLVLDQCDLVGDQVRRLTDALRRMAPNVRVILTSRERLEIPGVQFLSLEPLDVPAPAAAGLGADRLLSVGAVRLFVDRARLVDRAYVPDDAQAADIVLLCRRLDGLPLAIELAGARIGTLTPAQIVERLDSVVREGAESSAAGPGSRPRHATLDACIRWSFDLLAPPERALLSRLSVFKGGWTLEAAEAICAGGEPDIRSQDIRLLLARLVNKSLITYDAISGRYSMLESVKAFASEQLDARVRGVLCVQHFNYFCQFARRTEAQILGNEQTVGLRAVQADIENLDAALDARDLPDIRPEQFLELARALHRFWYIRGHFREGIRRLQGALALAPHADPFLRSQVHNTIGTLAFGLDDLVAAETAFRDALSIMLVVGSSSQIAPLWDNVALACSEQGRAEEAEAAYLASLVLHQECGDHSGAVQTRLNFAYHHVRIRRLDRAEELCRECLESLRAMRDRKREAVALHNLGEIEYFRGRYAEAKPFFVESIRIKDELGDRRGLSISVYMYALVLLRQGAFVHAAALFAKSLEVRAELGISSLPMPQDVHDAAIAELSSGIGADVFAAAWNRGRELYDEEAVQTITLGAD